MSLTRRTGGPGDRAPPPGLTPGEGGPKDLKSRSARPAGCSRKTQSWTPGVGDPGEAVGSLHYFSRLAEVAAGRGSGSHVDE